MGLYMIFGRFLYKAWARRRTYYAITNQRARVLTTTFGERVESAFLNALPGLSISGGSGRLGSIIFGSQSGFGCNMANTGMPRWLAYQYGTPPLAFYDVPDVRSLYETVGRLREARAPR
jgi:hypothetical protein